MSSRPSRFRSADLIDAARLAVIKLIGAPNPPAPSPGKTVNLKPPEGWT